jgi:hypothetical protein
MLIHTAEAFFATNNMFEEDVNRDLQKRERSASP